VKPEPNSEIPPPLPHSDQAERDVLGAILVGNKSRETVFDALSKDDFFDLRHRHIYEAILNLRERGKPIDLLSVHDELTATGNLEPVGGIAYVANLGDGMPVGLTVESLIRIVKGKARLRALIHEAERIRESAFDPTNEPAELLDRAIEGLSSIARKAEEDSDEDTSYRAAAVRLLDGFNSADTLRIFSDVDELDRLTGGFRPGELVVLTAETGTGKTLFAQQTRRRACRDGRHTLFCSGEMLATHLVGRELCAEASVPPWKMRRPERITDEEMRALVEAASHECDRCRILDGELSLARIRRVARRMKRSDGVDLVVLDYDELIEAPGETEFDQQRTLARQAKSLAMELACPVILVSQLRKALSEEEAARPTLQRLYGSAAKVKHATFVIFVDREYVRELKGDETAARIVVLKNRDGRVGRIEAKFNVDTLCFEGVPHTDREMFDPKAAAAGEERRS
jgi:replicative DNA helicase